MFALPFRRESYTMCIGMRRKLKRRSFTSFTSGGARFLVGNTCVSFLTFDIGTSIARFCFSWKEKI